MVSDRWTVETLNATVDREIEALPRDIQTKYLMIVERIESVGLERLGSRIVKKLTGPIWEMRLRGRDGIARVLYVTVSGRRVVVVRAFAKKTQKVPKREIDLALKRVREVLL